jgi:hypothetical protein
VRERRGETERERTEKLGERGRREEEGEDFGQGERNRGEKAKEKEREIEREMLRETKR